MARKLYIFNPTGRVKPDGLAAEWVGGFSTSLPYLGDAHARLLGVGLYLTNQKLPPWLRTPVSGARFIKGGASRSDRDFGGWGMNHLGAS